MDEKTRIQTPDSQSRNSGESDQVEEKTRIMPSKVEGPKTVIMNPQIQDEDANELGMSSNSQEDVGIGSVIRGRFKLEKALGSGGMGNVFKALDRRKLEARDDEPHIAIKLLGEGFKDHPDAFVTLQREAKKTQALAHPNIVTVYDFDRDDDLIYMTMEELKGESLQDFIDKHELAPIDKAKAFNILIGIASGLAYAHSKGIVHSDLKPGNIFITDEDQVKVLDFGIARVASDSRLQDQYDVSELSALTPRFASIDMMEHRAPDPRDDIYALGIIACILLGGKHPYQGNTAIDARDKALLPEVPKAGKLLTRLIRDTVALEKKDRVESCEAWLSRFAFATKGYKKWFAGAILIASLAIGNLIYIEEVSEAVIPITDLSVEMQTEFWKYHEEATLALSFNDINGALFAMDKAYSIHFQNEEVIDLGHQILDLVETASQSQGASKSDIQDLVTVLNEYPAFQTEDYQIRIETLKDN